MTEVKEFRKKPRVVKAIQWLGQPELEINEAINDWVDIFHDVLLADGGTELFVYVPNGGYSLTVYKGDYIVIQGKKVKVYSEKLFKAKYEAL